MRYLILSIIIILFSGCIPSNGYDGFVYVQNNYVIGSKEYRIKPTKYKDSGQLIKDNSELIGDGLTHITKNKNGDLIYHIYSHALLSHKWTPKIWVGKCKIYEVVDPKTMIIKSWGFDKDGNPQSCRVGP